VQRETFTFTCILEREMRAGKRQLGMLRRRWTTLLKWIFNKCYWGTCTGFIQLRIGTSVWLLLSQ
jgi:hypothetical protein